MPTPAFEQDNSDPLQLFWATPAENRNSFVAGKHLGRFAMAALAITGVVATGGALALPVWAVAAVASSIALSNALGAGMDQSRSCQHEMGDALAADQNLGHSRARMFARGFTGGITGTLKRLPLAILGTPFWPALAAAIPFINKGTTGSYFPGLHQTPKVPPMQLTPETPDEQSRLPQPELLQFSFGAAVKKNTVGAPMADTAARAKPAPKPGF